MPKMAGGSSVTALFSMAKWMAERVSAKETGQIGRPQPRVVVFGHLALIHGIGVHAMKSVHAPLLFDAEAAA